MSYINPYISPTPAEAGVAVDVAAYQSAFPLTWFVDGASGSDALDGLTPATAKATPAALVGLVDGDRVLLKRGTTFPAWTITNSGIKVEPYGDTSLKPPRFAGYDDVLALVAQNAAGWTARGGAGEVGCQIASIVSSGVSARLSTDDGATAEAAGTIATQCGVELNAAAWTSVGKNRYFTTYAGVSSNVPRRVSINLGAARPFKRKKRMLQALGDAYVELSSSTVSIWIWSPDNPNSSNGSRTITSVISSALWFPVKPGNLQAGSTTVDVGTVGGKTRFTRSASTWANYIVGNKVTITASGNATLDGFTFEIGAVSGATFDLTVDTGVTLSANAVMLVTNNSCNITLFSPQGAPDTQSPPGTYTYFPQKIFTDSATLGSNGITIAGNSTTLRGLDVFGWRNDGIFAALAPDGLFGIDIRCHMSGGSGMIARGTGARNIFFTGTRDATLWKAALANRHLTVEDVPLSTLSFSHNGSQNGQDAQGFKLGNQSPNREYIPTWCFDTFDIVNNGADGLAYDTALGSVGLFTNWFAYNNGENAFDQKGGGSVIMGHFRAWQGPSSAGAGTHTIQLQGLNSIVMEDGWAISNAAPSGGMAINIAGSPSGRIRRCRALSDKNATMSMGDDVDSTRADGVNIDLLLEGNEIIGECPATFTALAAIYMRQGRVRSRHNTIISQGSFVLNLKGLLISPQTGVTSGYWLSRNDIIMSGGVSTNGQAVRKLDGAGFQLGMVDTLICREDNAANYFGSATSTNLTQAQVDAHIGTAGNLDPDNPFMCGTTPAGAASTTPVSGATGIILTDQITDGTADPLTMNRWAGDYRVSGDFAGCGDLWKISWDNGTVAPARGEKITFSGGATGYARNVFGLTVTAMTKANPGVFTTSQNHGRSIGDLIYVDRFNMSATTQLADGFYLVNSVPAANTLSLKTLAGVAVDTSAYTTFVSGQQSLFIHAAAGDMYLTELSAPVADNETFTGNDLAAGQVNGASVQGKLRRLHYDVESTGALLTFGQSLSDGTAVANLLSTQRNSATDCWLALFVPNTSADFTNNGTLTSTVDTRTFTIDGTLGYSPAYRTADTTQPVTPEDAWGNVHGWADLEVGTQSNQKDRISASAAANTITREGQSITNFFTASASATLSIATVGGKSRITRSSGSWSYDVGRPIIFYNFNAALDGNIYIVGAVSGSTFDLTVDTAITVSGDTDATVAQALAFGTTIGGVASPTDDIAAAMGLTPAANAGLVNATLADTFMVEGTGNVIDGVLWTVSTVTDRVITVTGDITLDLAANANARIYLKGKVDRGANRAKIGGNGRRYHG